MTILFITMAVVVGGALGMLLWATSHRTGGAPESLDELSEETMSCRHVPNLQQIGQIFESADFRYLSRKVDRAVLRGVRKERHRVALKFLQGLQDDFLRLQEVSSIVAALSPKVDASQEWRRFRLGIEFRIKLAALRTKYTLGLATPESFRDLAWLVSSLAVELEHTVNEIAAGAALAQGRRPSSQG